MRNTAKYVIRIEKDISFVYAYIGLIERVMENLMENALRHTPKGGSINLVLIPDKESVSVQVNDTGCGIPKEELPYIFDRFYQMDKHQHTKTPYSGLGLAISKRILELHHESIKVASTLNSGTTFTFQLPLRKSTQTPQ